ncbi:basic salivary proline-rich protein 2-like [Alexandromys fortis]|uniref:basic salivary proline-rich protein 2-like n=1 Tax=Alexandromys fortis TaxID=100897 RepID=UPI002152B718|nr:basic salivary proline-rich protein 2-like [Microtus fortis]
MASGRTCGPRSAPTPSARLHDAATETVYARPPRVRPRPRVPPVRSPRARGPTTKVPTNGPLYTKSPESELWDPGFPVARPRYQVPSTRTPHARAPRPPVLDGRARQQSTRGRPRKPQDPPGPGLVSRARPPAPAHGSPGQASKPGARGPASRRRPATMGSPRGWSPARDPKRAPASQGVPEPALPLTSAALCAPDPGRRPFDCSLCSGACLSRRRRQRCCCRRPGRAACQRPAAAGRTRQRPAPPRPAATRGPVPVEGERRSGGCQETGGSDARAGEAVAMATAGGDVRVRAPQPPETTGAPCRVRDTLL